MTAVAFEHAVGSRWIVSVILAAALLSLFKVFNGNLVAASRLVFAMGRRGLVDARVAQVHPQNQTPSVAVICVGLSTAACMFLGDAILVPVSDVGSLASAAGWLAACAAYYQMAPSRRQRLVAAVGALVGSADDPDESGPVRARTLQHLRMAGLGNLDRAGRDRGAARNNVAPAFRRLSGGRLAHPDVCRILSVEVEN